MRRSRSIRTRLLVSIIALTAGPLILVGLALARQGFITLQEQGLNAQRQGAVLLSTQVTSLISGLENQLHMLIQVRGLKDLSVDQQKSLLTELLSYQSGFEDLALLNNKGQEQIRVSRTGVTSEADLADRSKSDEFLTPSTTGKVYYSPVRVNQTTGEPFMTLAVPTVDFRSGAVDSVLVAEVRFKPVWDLVASIKTGENDTAYILDSQERVVAHPDPSVVLKGIRFTPASPSGLQYYLNIQNGLSGTSVVLVTNTIWFGDQEYTVVVERPTTDALALSINTVAVTTLVIIPAILLAIGIGFWSVRRLVRPIQSLETTVQAITAGDLSRQAEVANDDEVGRLATAFNSMTTRLRQTLEGLQQHVEELEKARAERERLIRELRESSRLKSEFLSTMSHELRTPLNAMIGFTELMIAGTAGALNDKQTHQLSRIHANSLRLLSLIDNVLDLSRIEAGRVEIQRDPFSPREMVAKVAAQTSSLADQRGLRYLVSVDEALPETLLGDQPRIEQVLINMLSNAFKFTEAGEVELSIKVLPDQQRWTLSVRDTGIGIPPHAQEYIFEEFRQVDGSSRRVYGGSGLGLAIARNLSRLMGGDIRVHSTLGQGSTFTVTLPLEVAQIAPTPEPVTALAH